MIISSALDILAYCGELIDFAKIESGECYLLVDLLRSESLLVSNEDLEMRAGLLLFVEPLSLFNMGLISL